MKNITYWKDRANNTVNCSHNLGNFGQNRLITKAYADLYYKRPDIFKWAGMAAYASSFAGYGLSAGKTIDIFSDLIFRDKFLSDIDSRINSTNLDNMLVEGNKAVFRDIYWQHLVYLESGYQELAKILRNSIAHPLVIEGWELINRGEVNKNQDLVWLGNKKLLRFEQWVTLQKVYDRYPTTSNTLSYVVISPLPRHYSPFRYNYPHQSIRNPAARWQWIENELLPHWKNLDKNSVFVLLQQALSYRFLSKEMICEISNFTKRFYR